MLEIETWVNFGYLSIDLKDKLFFSYTRITPTNLGNLWFMVKWLSESDRRLEISNKCCIFCTFRHSVSQPIKLSLAFCVWVHHLMSPPRIVIEIVCSSFELYVPTKRKEKPYCRNNQQHNSISNTSTHILCECICVSLHIRTYISPDS